MNTQWLIEKVKSVLFYTAVISFVAYIILNDPAFLGLTVPAVVLLALPEIIKDKK